MTSFRENWTDVRKCLFRGGNIKSHDIMETTSGLSWGFLSKNHVQTAREFHDLNMDCIVWTPLLVCSTVASNSFVNRFPWTSLQHGSRGPRLRSCSLNGLCKNDHHQEDQKWCLSIFVSVCLPLIYVISCLITQIYCFFYVCLFLVLTKILFNKEFRRFRQDYWKKSLKNL